MATIQASKKANEKETYANLKDNREVQKPKTKLGLELEFNQFVEQIILI